MARALRCTKQAQSSSENDDYEEAEKLLLEAIRLMPSERSFVQNYTGFCSEVAAMAMEDENFEEAARWLHCTLNHAPDDAETWLDLGTAYANQDMPLEALQAWGECLKSLKRAKEIEKQCTEMIAENVMIVAKALDLKLSVKEEKKALRGAIAQLITALKTHA